MKPLIATLLLATITFAAPPTSRPSGIKLKADAPEHVRSYVTRAVDAVPDALKTAEDWLSRSQKELARANRARINKAGGRSSRNDDSITFRSADEKKAAVARAEEAVDLAKARVEELSKPDAMVRLPMVSKDTPPLAVGAIGYIERITVSRVVDETQIVASIPYEVSKFIVRDGQYIDRGDIAYTNPLLISGIDTTGYTDDTGVALNRTFEIVGTTKVGSRTTFELKPFDLSKYRAE